jgi:hypothetical protein
MIAGPAETSATAARASPFELPARIAERIGRFSGRAWLLPELLRWWQGSDRFFVLKGGPGTGKSMISAWLCGHGPAPADPAARARLLELRSAVGVAHFCQANSFSIGPRAFAEAAANQLLATVPGFESALLASRGTQAIHVSVTTRDVAAGATVTGIRHVTLGEAPDSVTFNNGFVKPLQALYRQGHDRPLLVIIDALDEEMTYDGTATLVELLSRLEALPEQVRFILTTRDEARVLQYFDSPPFDLISQAPANVDDVRDYVRDRLRARSQDIGRIQRVADRVATAAEGVFLYAALVLDDLTDALLADDQGALSALPVGLPGIYREFLRRELGVEDKGKQWIRVYRPMLGCLAVSQGAGLSVELLRDLVGDGVEVALEACQQYLVGSMPRGPWRLFHKSFADFLLGESQDVRYRIDAADMHARIADKLWAKFSNDWSRSDAYTLQSLAVHLTSGRCFDRFDALLSQAWLRARSPDGALDDFGADVDRIWYASRGNPDRQASFITGLRCALLRGSIHANARQYPVSLVIRAFELGLLSADRVFSLQQDISDEEKVRLSVGLLKQESLSREVFTEAYAVGMTTALHSMDPEQRVRSLAQIARVVPRPLQAQAMDAAIEAVHAITDVELFARAAWHLIETSEPAEREGLVDELLDRLDRLDRSPIGGHDSHVGHVLQNLAPLVSGAQASRLRQLAPDKAGVWSDDVELNVLARLPETSRAGAIDAWLSRFAAQFSIHLDSCGDDDDFPEKIVQQDLRALHGLMGALSESQKQSLAKLAETWHPRMSALIRAQWRFQFEPLLGRCDLSVLAAEAETLATSSLRASARWWLATHGDHERRRQWFMRSLADPADDTFQDFDLTCAWIPLLADDQKPAAVDRMLELARKLASVEPTFNARVQNVMSCLEQSLGHLAEAEFRRVMDLLEGQYPPIERLHFRARFANRLDAAQVSAAIAACASSQDGFHQCAAFAAIARTSGESIRTRALERAMDALAKTSGYSKLGSIQELLPMLPADRLKPLLDEAATTLGTAQNLAGLALRSLAPHFDAAQARIASQSLDAIGRDLDGETRLTCRLLLARQISDEARRSLVDELLPELPNHTHSRRACDAILDACDRDQLEHAFELALKAVDEAVVAYPLFELARRVGGTAPARTVERIRPIFEYLLANDLELAIHFACLQQGADGSTALSAVLERIRGRQALPRASLLPTLQKLLPAALVTRVVDSCLDDLASLTAQEQAGMVRWIERFLDLNQRIRANPLVKAIPNQHLRLEWNISMALQLANDWQHDDRTQLLHTLGEILLSLYSADRRRVLELVAGLAHARFSPGESFTEHLFTTLDEIIHHWHFDAAALEAPQGSTRVH